MIWTPESKIGRTSSWHRTTPVAKSVRRSSKGKFFLLIWYLHQPLKTYWIRSSKKKRNMNQWSATYTSRWRTTHSVFSYSFTFIERNVPWWASLSRVASESTLSAGFALGAGRAMFCGEAARSRQKWRFQVDNYCHVDIFISFGWFGLQ